MQVGDAFKMMTYPSLKHINIKTARRMRQRAEINYKRRFILCWAGTYLYCFRVEKRGAGPWYDRIVAAYDLADATMNYPWDRLPLPSRRGFFSFPSFVTHSEMLRMIRRVEKKTGKKFVIGLGNRVWRTK
jgi:hypothetical protein